MSEATSDPQTAVMMMAYGGPDCLDAVGPFMNELTGREPAGEMLARIQARYAAIGGKSPLPEIAARMARALTAELAADGFTVPVEVGFRYTPPKIGDVLRALYQTGVRRIVAVSLSPFESRSTSTAYAGAVNEALVDLPGLEVVYPSALGKLPAFVAAHARSLSAARERAAARADRVLTVFTAHSLPVEDLETPELYISGLRRVASDIAEQLGLGAGSEFERSGWLPGVKSFGEPDTSQPWLIAYQSKGMRPGEWLGPDLGDVMADAKAAGFRAVVVSPIGFATEHMETRYDLDVVEARRASDLGLVFERGDAPDDSPSLIAAISAEVEREIER